MRAVCLDLTRLMRRAHLAHPTGIDRVERAYLSRLLTLQNPLFGLVRDRQNLFVVDRAGVEAFAQLIATPQPTPLPRSLFRPTLQRRKSTVMALVANRAIARRPIARGLAGALPTGTCYFNIGHSNLDPRVLEGLLQVEGMHIAVMIHDTIPLDWPAFQRPGMEKEFARRFNAVMAHANCVIVPSQAVAAALRRHADPTPPVSVAPLGVSLPAPAPTLPADLDPRPPYFVSVGTIEPRKNHAILLDLWGSLARPRPQLFIVGRRGWRNEELFARLDRGVDGVHECPDLDDASLARLISGAAGLLQPSVDEGFGLPPHEAASLGVTPVCAPLSVYSETLGQAAVYADPHDLYQWDKAVADLLKRQTQETQAPRGPLDGYTPPGWDAHFKVALTMIC